MTQRTIQIPKEIYEAVQEQAARQHTTPDTLVTEWVSAHLDTENNSKDEILTAFEREIAAFETLKPKLLKEYPGQYVAIHNGEVVVSGGNKLEVSRQAREQLGQAVYYVELVSPDSPRTVRMPSVRVSRE